ASPRPRVEFLPVALEFRPFRRLISRFRQPLVPNREPRSPNRRDVITMRKHRISLFRNAQTAQLRGDLGKIGHLNTADVFRVASIVALAEYAIGRLADLSGDMAQVRSKSLPLRGNARTGVRVVAFTQSR